jgi:hypothetical protein
MRDEVYTYLHKMISNRQTKTASSPGDVVQVDFHTDATYSNRIPTRPYIVDDSNREYYKAQAEKAKQKREDERTHLAKKLQCCKMSIYAKVLSYNRSIGPDSSSRRITS